MWNVGGMIIPEGSRSVLKKTYSTATSPTANTTWTLLNAEPVSGMEKFACPELVQLFYPLSSKHFSQYLLSDIYINTNWSEKS